MAFTYGFYNYSDSDPLDDLKEYDAVEVSRLFDGLITDGVYAHIGSKFAVSPSKNSNDVTVDNQVVISTGRAWFNHTWNYLDAPFIFDAPAPETINKRIDALVIDINSETRHNEFLWVKGTPHATSPQKPTLINDGLRFQHPIAYVTRLGGTAKIEAQYIENAVGVDSLTPYVTGVLESVSVENLVSQMEASINAWMTGKKAEVNAWFAEEQTDFDTWFNNIKGQLSEDAAGNLQNEIDSITLGRSGTASSTGVSKQYLKVNGSNVAEISGTAYMEQRKALSVNSSVTYTFSNALITNDSAISVYSGRENTNYENISVDGTNHTCSVTYPANPSGSVYMTVRIYIRND